jgi:putative methyltransferase (TIGR04325 family)
MDTKYIFNQFLPPIIASAIKRILQKSQLPEWEYMPNGWSAKYGRIRGWNDQSIAEAQRARWPVFVHSLKGTKPLTSSLTWLSPKLTRHNVSAHNISMCYGYVLALAAREKHELSILDWGGGIGHYYLISRALLPSLKIQYTCHDKPLLCKLGKELLPEADFYEDPDEIFRRRYDLVFASNSLQYSENWQEVARKLAAATRNYLYIAQLPIVHKAESFVILQRAYKIKKYQYDTEYLGWVLNRKEFVKCIEQMGMRLVREFLAGEGPWLPKAPEQSELLGFLFVPNAC